MFDFDKFCASLPSETDVKAILARSEFVTLRYLPMKELMQGDELPLMKYPRYIITRTGVVVNKKTGKPVKTQTQDNGYQIIFVRDGSLKEGKSYHKGLLLHRAMMSSFTDEITLREHVKNKRFEVNHLDYDKTNNNLENLEWVDKMSNTRHAICGDRYRKLLKPNQLIRYKNGKRTIIEQDKI